MARDFSDADVAVSRMMTFGRRSLSMALTAEEKRGSPWVSGASQVYFVFFLRKCACHMYIFYIFVFIFVFAL